VTLLRRYIMFSVFRGVATALAVLVAVGSCIELVGQLDDLGTGDFGLAEALTYVALRIPRTVFETLPAAALIGSLLSLGNLAVHRELIVMRASGISPLQLLTSAGLAGFGFAVVMVLLGESLAPSLGAYASELRARALLEDVDMADGQSTWLKDGDRIFSLDRQAGNFGYGGGVLLFENGLPHDEAAPQAAEQLKKNTVQIDVNLGGGRAEATIWGCDLSAEYVRINGEYRT